MGATGVESDAPPQAKAKPSLGAASSSAPASEAAWPRPLIAWYGVAMVCAVTVFGQLDRAIMPLLVSSIKRDMQLSDTQISLLLGAAYSVVYLCAGIPMARITDSGRRTLILPAALGLWSLGTVLCGAAQSFAQFFLFRGMIGGGESIKGPTSVSLIPDLLPREKLQTAFGLYNTAVMGGEALALILGGLLLGWLARHAPLHIPALGEVHSWQMVYFIFGLPGVLLALVFVTTVREPARHGRRNAGAAPILDLVAS